MPAENGASSAGRYKRAVPETWRIRCFLRGFGGYLSEHKPVLTGGTSAGRAVARGASRPLGRRTRSGLIRRCYMGGSVTVTWGHGGIPSVEHCFHIPLSPPTSSPPSPPQKPARCPRRRPQPPCPPPPHPTDDGELGIVGRLVPAPTDASASSRTGRDVLQRRLKVGAPPRYRRARADTAALADARPHAAPALTRARARTPCVITLNPASRRHKAQAKPASTVSGCSQARAHGSHTRRGASL